jgi:hypothetical protein
VFFCQIRKRSETEAIAQVMLPVLRGVPSMTKEEWVVIAQVVDKLFE